MYTPGSSGRVGCHSVYLKCSSVSRGVKELVQGDTGCTIVKLCRELSVVDYLSCLGVSGFIVIDSHRNVRV